MSSRVTSAIRFSPSSLIICRRTWMYNQSMWWHGYGRTASEATFHNTRRPWGIYAGMWRCRFAQEPPFPCRKLPRGFFRKESPVCHLRPQYLFCNTHAHLSGLCCTWEFVFFCCHFSTSKCNQCCIFVLPKPHDLLKGAICFLAHFGRLLSFPQVLPDRCI